jgi:hypothetical protein
MTRNQWIGAGCGGAGCLGLIVVILAAGFIYWSYRRPNAIFDANSNSSRSSDQNSNTTSSEPVNRKSNHNSSTTNSGPGSSSTLSDDNRHKLFQAASTTSDSELMEKVNKKLGLLDADGAPGKAYADFVKDHVVWIFKNTDWITEYNTPEKARAYVDEHIND